MIEIPSLRPETRYGVPTCDRYLFNRLYAVGYSYLLRQPRFAMQVVDEDTMKAPKEAFDRLDNFREDMRVPDMFRSTLNDYRNSGFDRGHLINSADRKHRKVINSETFLMSNMAPQLPHLNRKIWLDLEDAIRELAAKEEYAEVYTMCGPLFNSVLDPAAHKQVERGQVKAESGDVDSQITHIGENRVAVPRAFFKAVLAERTQEDSTRQLDMWCFEMPNRQEELDANKAAGKELADYLVPTNQTEQRASTLR